MAWVWFTLASSSTGVNRPRPIDVSKTHRRSVESMDENGIALAFFDSYTRAMLERDAGGVASHYAVPCLIEFPDQAIAISHARQTEEFFAGAFAQYQEVTAANAP